MRKIWKGETNSMKKKMIIGFFSAALVTGGGFYAYSSHVEAVESKKVEVQQRETISGIQAKVNALYMDKTKEFLAKDVTAKKIQRIKKDLEKQEGKGFSIDNAGKLNTAIMELGYAESMFNLQSLVHNLTEQQNTLIDAAALKQVEKKLEELKINKPKFAAEQEKQIVNVRNELKQAEETNNQVSRLFTSTDRKEVRKDVTRDAYVVAKALVVKVKQEKVKVELSQSLNKVNQYLTVKEENEKKAKETQQLQEQPQSSSVSAQPNRNERSNSSKKVSGSQNKTTNTPNSAIGSTKKISGSNKPSSGSATNGSNKQKSPTKESSGTNNGSKNNQLKPGDSITIELDQGGEIDRGGTWEGGWTE